MSFQSRLPLLVLFTMLFQLLQAQTSWKGTSSTSWSNANNWTNGVPNATTDAIIGDANFTGSSQPTISSSATCKSLTIGGGSKASTLTVNRSLTVSGSVLINSNGTISNGAYTITLTGNWTKNGTYTANSGSSRVTFAGTSQTIGGSSATTFRRLTVNTGSTVTLASNVTLSGTSSILTVNGTLNPGESPTYTVTGTALTVNANAVLHVKASTFAGNYAMSGTVTLNSGNIIDYSSITTAQTVSSSYQYSTLRISGSGTKSLAANLTALRSATAAEGNIYVNGGTFDLSSFTAGRGSTVTGGTLSVANGASLKIGGTNTFPANYNTRTLGLTSTVEYSGTAQTVSAQAYGNLALSSASGAAVKTMPASALLLAGDLTSSVGAGTSVSFAAAANITVNGSVSIGAGTTFDGASFSHSVTGNWTNNGTFTGNSSTLTFIAPGATISGTGTHNFNNLVISASGVTAAATSALSVAGSFSTSGAGTFVHNAGGTFTMSGSSKTITGTGITFDNLSVTGSVSTGSSVSLTGNLSVAGTLSASSGVITMSGTSKSISGAGTKSLSSLNINGSVTSGVSFSIASALNVSGSFTASAGTATFTGSSTLNGTANLFNVTLNGTELKLSTDAVLGIAGALTITAGNLNVTSSTPNTVNFNSTGAQSVNGLVYHHLSLSGGNTKTAAAGIALNGDMLIGSSTTFNASSLTHSIYGNWTNNGTFTASTGTVQFVGPSNTTITGATTFGSLTVMKSTSVTGLTLASNVSVATLNMVTGWMNTGSNTVTITTTRTGSGIILGNIQRTHGFTSGTAYAFEGPDNTLTINGLHTVSSVTISVTQGTVSDFPFGGSTNRVYNISCTGMFIVATATLRLHYEDNELNGNNESTMQLWRNTSNSWAASGKTASSTSSNYIEQNNLGTFVGRWTFSDDANVVRWTGASSSAWGTAGNWSVVQGSASTPPTAGDIVQLGSVATSNQPVISTAVSVKSISFSSTQAVSLSVASGGSLTTNGISGSWSGNATHSISMDAQNLTVNGDLNLSDGTSNHVINLGIGSGAVNITGSLVQSGGAGITFSGAGTLSIGNNFSYTSGTFTPGSGTVIYNGSVPQTVAGVTYNHLTINKASGIAAINSAGTINGNLTVSAGELDINAVTSIAGNVSIASGAIINGDGVTTSVGGNWSNSGSFVSATGTIQLNGTGLQTVSATTFNNLAISKTSGTASLSANISLNGNLSVLSGTLDLGTYTANRNGMGGTFTLSNGTTLLLSGSNFPAAYAAYTLGSTSTTNYNGSSVQTITGGISYGHLLLSNGSGTKLLGASATVNGDLTISSGSAFDASAFTITLGGNWNNSGTFTPSTGTVIMAGTNKTVNGNTTFNRVTVTGTYTVSNNDIILNGRFYVTPTGAYAAGSGTHTVNGDLVNSGVLTSTGVTTFTGTTTQTIQLLNAITSNSFGVINFNGTVPPILNSTSMPTYANLNINNTGGVTASVDWKVLVSFTIGSGATFNAGSFSDTISGSFTNNGTVTSSGTLFFTPSGTTTTVALGSGLSSTGTLRFGGSAPLVITGTPAAMNNVIISNINAAGITPPSAWNIGGTLTIRSNATLNGSSYTHTVAGDIESDGTLNGQSSTFVMSAFSGELSGSANTTFNNLLITGNITANSDFNVSGDLTNNGTLDATQGSPIMTGTGPSLISSNASPSAIAQLVIQKTNATATLGVNLSGITELDVTSGIFSIGSYSLTQDAAGGILLVNDSGTLRIGGSTAPVFNTYSLDTFSTVEYNSTAAQSIAAWPYGNLLLSNSGTKTAAAALSLVSNFSMTGGTFVGSNYTHSVGGNWNMSGGTFSNTGTTVLFNGTAAQSVNSTGAFNHVTVNKSIGNVTLAADATVNGTLTFTSGNIATGNNKLALGTSASVARTSGHVVGTLQKNVPTGATSRTFEIGDNTNYTPVTVAFANVTGTGSLAASTNAGDHPDIANSGLSSSKSVNRYWTLSNAGVTFTTYNATFSFVAGDVDGGSTTANFYVTNKINNSWLYPLTGTRTATSTQVTGTVNFGDFQIGEFGSKIWDGGAGTVNWNDAANWGPDGVPLSTESILIPTGTAISVNTAGTCKDLIMNSPGLVMTLATGGSLTVNGVLNAALGELKINGQNLYLNGSMLSTGNGTITGSATSSLTIGGTTGGDFGTLRMTAGSLNNQLQNFTLNRTGSSGVITIGSNGMEVNGTVQLTSGTLVTGSNLTLLSSSLAATARIAKIGSAADISGIVNVQRYIPAGTARRWEFLSSPITNFDYTQFTDDIYVTGTGGAANGFDVSQTNNPTAYTYTESVPGTADYGWITAPSITSAVATGKGMRIYYRGNRNQGSALLLANPPAPQATVIDFTGSINKGNVSFPVSCSNGCTSDDGWNLVGNPYPSPIDWDAAGWTKTNISSAIYIFNPNTNVYAVWDGTVGTNGGSGYIPLGQSFMVRASGTPVLSATEDVKTAALPAMQMFKTGIPYVRMKLVKDSLNTDEAVIKFSGSSALYDLDDALKLFNPVVNLSSFSSDNRYLVINAWPGLSGNDTIRLSAYVSQPGTYQLQFPDFHGLPPQINVFLLDSFTHTMLDVQANPSYTFTVTANALSQGDNRFRLVFVNPDALPVTYLDLHAEKQNAHEVKVSWSTASEHNSKLFVIQHSTDGTAFEDAGQVTASGNRAAVKKYSWTDHAAPAQVNYYRLKQVDLDRSYAYSKVVSVDLTPADIQQVTLYPVPARDQLHISGIGFTGDAEVRISNTLGQVLFSHQSYFPGKGATASIDVSGMQEGVYFIEIIVPGSIPVKYSFIRSGY